MGKDNRKKGCPNTSCERHKKHVKLDSSEEFCPKCGTKLIYVCKKCFTEIEDIDFNHKICKRCEEKSEDKKQFAKDAAAKVGKGAVGLVTPVAIGIGKNVSRDGRKVVIKKGTAVIEGAIKTMAKK